MDASLIYDLMNSTFQYLMKVNDLLTIFFNNFLDNKNIKN